MSLPTCTANTQTKKNFSIPCKRKPEITKVNTTEKFKEAQGEFKKPYFDINEYDFQLELKKWLAAQYDKPKEKDWWDKLHKLAVKLKNPQVTERLRQKIVKYLETAPSVFSDEEEKIEFRRQIPSYTIKNLKKMYLDSANLEPDIRKAKKPKYYSRCKIEILKEAILQWLKNINLKKKDFLDRSVNKGDIFNHLIDKLETLILDGPKSELEYKDALTCIVTDIVNDLTIVIDSKNKENKLKNITATLVTEILNIDTKIPFTYIQPTLAEIKLFVKEQITYLLEKTRTVISSKSIEHLETELTDQLLDLIDVKDVESSTTADNIKQMLRGVTKISEEKAKYFTNIIVTDYKEFFFRQHFFNGKEKVEMLPDICSDFLNISDPLNPTDDKETNYVEGFRQRLIEVLDRWFFKMSEEINPSIKKYVIKNIAGDIIDRFQYLQMDSHNSETSLEELEYLKYQIFKRTKILGKEFTTITMEHITELMELIKQIPLPDTFDLEASPCCSTQLGKNKDGICNNIVNEVWDWFQKQPLDVKGLIDSTFNKDSIRNLVDNIEKYINNKEFEAFDNKINGWVRKIYNGRLGNEYVERMKEEIKDAFNYNKCVGENLEINPKEQKIAIRKYEDIIDEWIEIIPLQTTKKDGSINMRNEIVRELATKLYESKKKIKLIDMNNKLQDIVLNFMKKLPLDPKINNRSRRCEYATNLLKNIEASPPKNYMGLKPKYTLDIDKLEREIENSDKLEVNQSNVLAQNILIQLRQFYNEDDDFIANIEAWVNKLPTASINGKNLNALKNKFVKSIKHYKDLGLNKDRIMKEIIRFMRLLAIEISSKQNEEYLHDEALNLVQILTQERNSKNDPMNGHLLIKSVGDAIKDWAKVLSLESEYNPRDLKQSIEEMTTVITAMLKQPGQGLIEKRYQQINEEINKYLKMLPLRQECRSEPRISKVTSNLARNLINIHLNDQHNIVSNDIIKNNVTVYGFSVKNKSNEFSIQSLKSDDINSNVEVYTREVVHQISDWLNSLNLKIKQDEAFKKVVINDLAGDIVDRFKYLELHPQSRKSPDDELEQLKYQIFKWVNKLVGEKNIDTVAHADDLMRRIQAIPAPMLTEPQNNPRRRSLDKKSDLSKKAPVKKEDFDKPRHGSNIGGDSFKAEATRSSFKHLSSPEEDAFPISPNMESEQFQNSAEVILEKYQKIFKEKVYELPINTPTPDSAELAHLARTAMYNGIIKTIFTLKADSDIENDYTYFQLMLEDKLDEMLDVLPQIDEIKKNRESWKCTIISNAINMLIELQRITDRESFKQRIKSGLNRKLIRERELEHCFMLQQKYLPEVAEAYLLETKYKEEDPLKANIYKQRLMKKVDEFVNHITKEHNTHFKYLNARLLTQQALKVLDSVPIPKDDVLDEEVAEILLAEEIEKWYNELPTEPCLNKYKEVARKRMIDLLSKKLCEIEKNEDELNASKERKMKHEISHFLEKRGGLVKDEDLNINFMVDELSNRIKNMKTKDITYDGFENNKPVCSTFAEIDNVETLAPLIDVPAVTRHTLASDQVAFQQVDASQVGPQNQSIAESRFPANICTGSKLQTIQNIPYQAQAQSFQGVTTNQIDHSVIYAPPPEDEKQIIDHLPPKVSPRQSYISLRLRRKDISRPGPPPNTPYERFLDPQTQPIHGTTFFPSHVGPSQLNAPKQGTGQSHGRSPTSLQAACLRSSHVGPSYSAAPTQNMVSGASTTAQRGQPPYRPWLNGTANQQRQRAQNPNSLPTNGTSSQQTRGGPVHPERVQGNICDGQVPPQMQGNYRTCRNFPADMGVPCPSYIEDREDEEGRERILLKCRCMERFRRRRRICLDSLPCPEFRSPCRYYFD